MKKLILLSLVFTLWACNSDDNQTEDPVFCTEEARPGIEITFRDASDGMFLVEGVEVIITDDGYKETLTNFSGDSIFFGAYERTGTYIVVVSKNEYQTQTSDPIVVDKDICHVITKNIEIVLIRK